MGLGQEGVDILQMVIPRQTLICVLILPISIDLVKLHCAQIPSSDRPVKRRRTQQIRVTWMHFAVLHLRSVADIRLKPDFLSLNVV